MINKNKFFTVFLIRTFCVVVALCTFTVVPVMAAVSDAEKSCDTDTNDEINPIYVLCSTHAYNVGLGTNPKDSAQRSNMEYVIGLKTSIIAQQMKANYDFLDASVRQLKTQLRKSIYNAKLQVAGADGTSSSGGGSSSMLAKSTDKAIVLAGTKNCRIDTSGDEDFIKCTEDNLSQVINAINAGQYAAAKKQLKQDVEAFNKAALSSYEGSPTLSKQLTKQKDKNGNMVIKEPDNATDSSCPDDINDLPNRKSDIQNCVAHFKKIIGWHKDIVKRSNQSSNGGFRFVAGY